MYILYVEEKAKKCIEKCQNLNNSLDILSKTIIQYFLRSRIYLAIENILNNGE